jgi:hypothetical protein
MLAAQGLGAPAGTFIPILEEKCILNAIDNVALLVVLLLQEMTLMFSS